MNTIKASYRSGVAARMAGVPVETLRVWERRYGVISPSKSDSGQRLYTAEEVQRLVLIKQLLDLGHPIGAIARLPDDDLKAMFSALAAHTRPESSAARDAAALRVALAGPTLSSARFRQALNSDAAEVGLDIVGYATTQEALVSVAADLVVLELPTLNDRSVAEVTRLTARCDAAKAIVLYRYGRSGSIRALREAGHGVAHALSDTNELAALCRTLLRLPNAPSERAAPTIDHGATGQPRFDEQALMTFAEASSTVHCECPRHLVELIVSLTAFERYSAECSNRDPADEQLHRDLQHAAARARALIEDAVERVAAQEGRSIRSAD